MKEKIKKFLKWAFKWLKRCHHALMHKHENEEK